MTDEALPIFYFIFQLKRSSFTHSLSPFLSQSPYVGIQLLFYYFLIEFMPVDFVILIDLKMKLLL